MQCNEIDAMSMNYMQCQWNECNVNGSNAFCEKPLQCKWIHCIANESDVMSIIECNVTEVNATLMILMQINKWRQCQWIECNVTDLHAWMQCHWIECNVIELHVTSTMWMPCQ